jgi:N-methylhydantoinase B
VFNAKGEMLAQAVTGTPGHVNSMARSVMHFLDAIPAHTMKPGDSFITNDPWKGTGHLFDLTVFTPAFHKGRLVAFFASTAHVADIGGNGPSPDSRDVFSEGLFIPISPLCVAGEMNKLLLDIMRANSREPDKLEGDVYALVACNEAGCDRLGKMMDEYGLADITALSDHILTSTDRSMKEAIAALPKGKWTNSMRIDGFDEPVDFVATLTIDDENIHVDFTGSSPQSKWGINCPICYADAYTTFGVKCIVAPRLAHNHAVRSRIHITAPEGTIVNAPPPAPVTARAVIGQMLPDVVFGCFDKARAGLAPAEGTDASWSLRLNGNPGITGHRGGSNFMAQSFQSGGMGAHPKKDGLSATPFPSGVKAIAIEITEAMTPMVFWKKELRRDSGGAGKRRGGLGQSMEVASREAAPFALFARFERVDHPARGRHGGHDGAAGTLGLQSGKTLKPKGTHVIPIGDKLMIEMPGGGGFGDPAERDVEEVLADVRDGFVSVASAREIYKVAIVDGAIDTEATKSLRAQGGAP